MQKLNTNKLARIALIAALYAALSLALSPLSYGAVQIRFSEALTLLPVIMPGAVIGVTVGCFVTNLVGVFTGANILGVLDVFFGTLATFCAAVCTLRLKHIRTKGLPLAAAVPPVLINAVVIGAELTFVTVGTFNTAVFLVQSLWVALGQFAACFVLGTWLVRFIEKSDMLSNIFKNKSEK